MLRKPTKRQKEILDYILNCTNENGYAPSYLEIGEHFGLSSSATVAEHVQTLREKGYLDWEEGEARSLEVVRTPEKWSRAFELPLVGLITAGQPIEAVEEKETFAVPT